MKPTEELFHLAQARHEMTNSASDPQHATTLDTMRKHYDTELAAIAPNLAHGHGYENYPTHFSRTIPWEQKAAMARGNSVKEDKSGEDEPTTNPKSKRRAKQ
jgi:hypothetical protein